MRIIIIIIMVHAFNDGLVSKWRFTPITISYSVYCAILAASEHFFTHGNQNWNSRRSLKSLVGLWLSQQL
jgi:hypothetical protein